MPLEFTRPRNSEAVEAYGGTKEIMKDVIARAL